MYNHIEGFRKDLEQSLPPSINQEIHERTAPHATGFFYSILVPVYKPEPKFLKIALESALKQTYPNFEVLVGLDGPHEKDIHDVIEGLEEKYSDQIRRFEIDRKATGGGISATTNYLANASKGDFLLLMDHDDWIRSDLLSHYDEVLSLENDPLSTVLYCNEFKINEKNTSLPNTQLEKPLKPVFPFVFNNFICHCLLISKSMWLKVGGLRSPYNGAQDYDLCLRLDLAGASFKNVPLYLYAWRVHSKSTAAKSDQKNYARDAGISALHEYISQKNRDWQVIHGKMPLTYRVLPLFEGKPKIHVIVSTSYQKKHLLKALEGVSLQKKDVELRISVLVRENPSSHMVKQIQDFGVEIVFVPPGDSIQKAYNKLIRQDNVSEAFFCMDESICLNSETIKQLCRWLLPEIGVISPQIIYPNGITFAGPIYFNQDSPLNPKPGEIPRLRKDGLRVWESTQGVTDSFFRGCFLLKREAFHQAGGFEEDDPIFEITFSAHLKRIRQLCFYTPYTQGVYQR